jgi:hypothetical protein
MAFYNAYDISVYLYEFHRGEQKAITSKNLCNLFHLNDKSLRNMINELRIDGTPICSSSKGYFYASSRDEVIKTIKHLSHRVDGINNALFGLKNIVVNAD